jgi:arylsulfatase A-like enzyme
VKKIISFVIKVLVTVLLFVLLFYPERLGLRPDLFGGMKPGDIVREIRAVEASHVLAWLSFALVVRLAGMMCGVLRWRILLRGQGLHMPFWYMVQSWFVGRTIGIFLPGTIGLDGYRLFDSSRYTGEVIKCTTVIAVEKLIGFISLTGLVFLTFPLGFRLLNINLPMLAVILTVLGGFVGACFLLLLNPRVIQVLVAVVPTPAAIRNQVNKIGGAATAYSGHRRELLLAVLCGVMVHFSACMMYFGTMMAIRTGNTSLFDILFASPLMIYGTVLGPSIGGEGIREIVFATLLGGRSSAAAAVAFAHLGWWVGDVVPFLIGLPIFVLRQRPGRAQLESGLAQARQAAAGTARDYLHLPVEVVADYRRKVFGAVAAGLMGGLIAGAIIGGCEAFWIARTLRGLSELHMFAWGPAVYGLLFAGVVLGIAGGLLFLYLLLDRFASWAATFAWSLGGALGAGGLVIGLWRLQRDVLAGHGGSMAQYAQVAAYVLGAALMAVVLAYAVAKSAGRLWRNKPALLIAEGLAFYLACIAVGGMYASAHRPVPPGAGFAPPVASQGPPIILVAIDALRADYLRLYRPSAAAQTPALDAFAGESVFFEHSFGQASWTKPGFATIFSGLYPESHTATNKTRGLPDNVETLAELLEAGGYYTKGFSNNPNVSTVFNFDQGFVDYTDLKPDRYFRASDSSSKLSMYEVLRKGLQRVEQKLKRIPGLGKTRVTDFYQPADVVTRLALEWIDGGAAKDAPFFLYLHYMDPHDPFMDHRKPGVGYARSVLTDKPDPALESVLREAYITEIEYMDRYLGELFAGLKQRGVFDRALIVFTADHGEEFYDHQGFWHGYTLYDEMIFVPILMKLPGNAHAGERNAGLARHVDLAPTMLHFAGLPKGAQMPGQPLFDAAGGFANAGIQYSYAENDFEGNILKAVRTVAEKLIHANADNVSKLAPVELYDMAQDPGEKNSVAEAPERVEALGALTRVLDEYQKVIQEHAAEPAGAAPVSGELKEQLESLGYLNQ